MKRKIYISVIAISTIFLAVFGIIPHHHHRGLACFITELCEQDNVINDEHTNHKEIPEQDAHEHLCITNLGLIVTTENHEIITNTLPRVSEFSLSSFFFLTVHLFRLLPQLAISNVLYGDCILICQLIPITESDGLRAPPYMLA